MTLRRPGGQPGGSFTDRVMARVAEEPTPTPARAFVRSLLHLRVRDALAALMAAWRLAFEPSTPVTASVRASAAALFLSVIVVVGAGGALVAGGALSSLGPDGAAAPAVAPGAASTPTPRPTVEPTPSPDPTPTAVASPSVAAQEVIEPSPRPKRETPEPTERQQDRKVKRETPEPKERERDERDEDEREPDD